jgi:peroxiredoxin Q/BCP
VSDSIASIRRNDIEPLGVNPGSAESHQQFREKISLPFELLVDEDMEVAKAYGAVKDDATGISRSVVVVGKNGTVVFSSAGAPAWPLVANVVKKADDG